MPNKGRSSNYGRVTAIIARFNSVNSEIIEQKLTIFVHDVMIIDYCHFIFYRQNISKFAEQAKNRLMSI